MSALSTFKADEAALLIAVPDDFREAMRRYRLRAGDEETWRSRTRMENAAWLIELLNARLADEQNFSAYIMELAGAWGAEFSDRRRKA